MRLAVPTLCVLLVACGDDPPPAAPPPTVKKVAEAAPAPVQAVAEAEYFYNAVGKRDPFRGLFVESVRDRGSEELEPSVCSEPLCLVDLDDLKVVAVVSGDANPLAMVEDRAGIGHIVRRHTRIGKGGGKVTQVLRECIVVTSFVSAGNDTKPVAKKDELCVSTDKRSQPALDLLQNKEFSP